jgi:hypothetical protein
VVRCIVKLQKIKVHQAGGAKIALEHRGIGHKVRRRVVNDRAALQYHNAVGKPQNLLCVLLHNDRTGAARPGDGAERPQQFLEDERSQPLRRLVPIAGICCSPPDNWLPKIPRRASNRGNIS